MICRMGLVVLLGLLVVPAAAYPSVRRYQVALITLAPGEPVFERFGHTLLSIKDWSSGSELVYSFGTFDGDAKPLWHKALHKRLRYWVTSMSPLLMTLRYDHREGQVQELDLDDEQASMLAARLAWNVRPENRDYPYDLFADNCVTRVRDLLDEASGGALRRHTGGLAPHTLREEVMQILAPVPLLAAVATLIYGPYTDARRSRWEGVFLPHTLHDLVAEVELGEGPARYALVTQERPWRGERFAPPSPLPHPLWGVLLGVLPLAYGLCSLARPRSRSRGRQVLCGMGALLALVSGSLGLSLAYLQTTPHACFQNNKNCDVLSPLGLLAAPMFGLLSRDRLGRHGQFALWLLVCAMVLLPLGHLTLHHFLSGCPQKHTAEAVGSLALQLPLVLIVWVGASTKTR